MKISIKLNGGKKIFASGNQDIQENHSDEEVVGVVQDASVWVCKPFDAVEVWPAEDSLEHVGDDEIGQISFAVCLVQSDKGLQKANDHHGQQEEENQRLLHHGVDHDDHDAEESVEVAKEEHANPYEGSGHGKEPLRGDVVCVCIPWVQTVDGHYAECVGDKDDGVKSVVESARELDVAGAKVVEPLDFVERKAEGEGVKE
ncbi:hypothetical protein PMKS-003224 [Pichia membranifaciens]|uniref:Uncharacterized protein n=1 Tax=Pichia membranifaciens TaxID=4926 RepID=A0A1Q2YJK1_9ASCO|nr:hypothetical protein PMKS-003224 [Pichia membranifaciens]